MPVDSFEFPDDREDEGSNNTIPVISPLGGTGSMEAAGPKGSGFKGLLKVLGPGLVTGASDDDPSGIGTYAIAGASLGFATLWTVIVTFPMMAAVQFICAKIGMVSGQGLAGVLKEHYPKQIVYLAVTVLAIANAINAGADIGAIAAGFNLLVPIPAWTLIIPISLLILGIQIWGSYRLIANIFKWLTIVLFAYVGSAFFCKANLSEVLKGTFIPNLSWNAKSLSLYVAILGTTISPYMFFWQSNQEVEEEIAMGRKTLAQRKGATQKELKYAALDVSVGMIFSNIVMYFIILSTGATLFKSGKTDIQSATDAAQALRPIAGHAAEALLAIGLIGAGFLAVPILTGSSAYALAEAFGWKHGFDRKPERAKKFYALIIGLTVIGMMVNFVGINPIKALFWTAVINGLLAPPLLILVMIVSNNPAIMGKRTNGKMLNLLGWTTAIIMSVAAIALIATWK